MRVFDPYALHAQPDQFAHRHFPAAVFHGHHDSRHTVLRRKPLQIIGRADYGVPEYGSFRSGVARLGFQESHQIDIQIVTRFQFPRHVERHLARAKNEDVLFGGGKLPGTIEHHAVESNEGRDQKDADQENAAADQKPREDVVQRSQHQAGAAQRLAQTDQLLAAPANDVEVIQIAVIETELKDDDDHQPL